MRLTLDVIPHPAILALVVMHHLHDLQQVILAQLLQALGQFVHVERLLLAAALLFLLGPGADLALPLLALPVGGALAGNGPGLAQDLQKRGLGVFEGDDMLDFVARRLEIQVV